MSQNKMERGADKNDEPLLEQPADSIPPYAMVFMFTTILLEVSGTLLLRRAQDDVRVFFPAYALYFAGFSMFSFSLRYIPLSVAYSTWCALGTIGVSISSAYLYEEQIGWARWSCIVATVPPVIGMYILS